MPAVADGIGAARLSALQRDDLPDRLVFSDVRNREFAVRWTKHRLLVTCDNVRAWLFSERHEYRHLILIDDCCGPGQDEILMRKRLPETDPRRRSFRTTCFAHPSHPEFTCVPASDH